MEVFFYGLFMDENILKKNGLNPTNIRSAHLPDYTLKIGNRASLILSPGETAYGLVIKVDKAATLALYKESSLADYIAEEVVVITRGGESVKAICYNLPEQMLTGTNSAYATSLYNLAMRLDFPNAYLTHIWHMI